MNASSLTHLIKYAIEELSDQFTTAFHLRKSPNIHFGPAARDQLTGVWKESGRWSENETFIVTVVLQGFAVHTLVY